MVHFFSRLLHISGSMRIFFVVSIIVFTSRNFQQTDPIDVYQEIDNYINQSLSANRIPGLQLGIVQQGKVLYQHAYGEAERGRDMAITTPMFIGALTQSFTATAVMQLVDAGKVDLDASVQTYLPDFQVRSAASGQITVRQLLNQTSGLSPLAFHGALPAGASIQDRMLSLRRARLTAAPGERFQSFDPNYVILGRIIEKVSGMPYEEYLHRNILAPLEMNHTYTSVVTAQTDRLAQGYIAVLGYPVARNQHFHPYDLPAAYLISNVNDLTKFLLAQMSNGRYNDTQLVSPQSMAQMLAPDTAAGSQYAMGWYVQQSPYGQMIYASGDLNAFHADMMMYPAHNLGFVILINQNHLLYNWVEYAAMRAGIVDIFFKQSPPLAMSMSFLYQVIAVLIILDVVLEMRAFMRLPHQVDRLTRMAERKRRWLLGINFFVPLFVLFLLPPILQGIFVRPFSWQMLFMQLPVLVFWLFFAMVMVLARGVGRLWLLYRKEK